MGRQRLTLRLLDHLSATAGSARSTSYLTVLLLAFAVLGHNLAVGNDALDFCPIVTLSDGGRHQHQQAVDQADSLPTRIAALYAVLLQAGDVGADKSPRLNAGRKPHIAPAMYTATG